MAISQLAWRRKVLTSKQRFDEARYSIVFIVGRERRVLPLNTAAVISLSRASVSGRLHIYSPYLENVENVWE